MFDLRDLRSTVVPKSDQLNADQLLSGPMTVTVTDVRLADSAEQPLIIHYENDDGRPYKPCKTMRKVLIFAWGQDGHQWHGRSMTLYNDPTIKFGGSAVGGIRISHLSGIDREIQVSLAVTKGKKALHVIKVMRQQDIPTAQVVFEDTVESAIGKLREAALHGRDAMASVWKGLSKDVRDKIPKDQMPKPVEPVKTEVVDETQGS